MATMLVLIMVSTVQNLQILLLSDGLAMGKSLNWYAIPPEHGKRLERLAQGKLAICYLHDRLFVSEVFLQSRMSLC